MKRDGEEVGMGSTRARWDISCLWGEDAWDSRFSLEQIGCH